MQSIVREEENGSFRFITIADLIWICVNFLLILTASIETYHSSRVSSPIIPKREV